MVFQHVTFIFLVCLLVQRFSKWVKAPARRRSENFVPGLIKSNRTKLISFLTFWHKSLVVLEIEPLCSDKMSMTGSYSSQGNTKMFLIKPCKIGN